VSKSKGVVLITGAGRGLGLELSLRLGADGYAIAVMGRNKENVEKVSNQIIANGGKAAPYVGDVANFDDCQIAVTGAVRDLGPLYGVINNAGIAGPTAKLEQISVPDWLSVIDTNLNGVFYMCKVAIPELRKTGGGRIITIGSATGKRPLLGRTPYSASKIALVGLVRTLALELGREGITVNNVSPWLLEGDRLDTVIKKQEVVEGLAPGDGLKRLVKDTATGSLVSNDDIHAVIGFLLQENSRNFTGQDLNVSAGAVTF
jgi:NAD(P)-dependent dehydrogenase (short-subunit alcohol dehydrogenase family)